MSSYTRIKIVLTFLIAIVLSIMTYNFLQEYKTEVDIVVAKVEIKERELINPSTMLEVKRTTLNVKNLYMKNSASKLDFFKGSISKIKIPAGKVLDTTTDVVISDGSLEKSASGNTKNDSELSQSYFINGDERLLAIKLDSDSAVNNILKKGDLVDVFASFEKDQDKPERQTLMLAQRIAIFEVQKIEEDDRGAADQSIVLKVSIKQAGDIIWMKQHGKIDLVLSSTKAKPETAIPITQMTILKGNYGSSN